jgi:acetylglutamate kinase
MKVLIKLGGTLLDSPEKRADMARQLALAAKQCEVTVVHGGGKQVTKFLEERGVKSEFVNGLRVSDEAVIDAVTKVIAGGVNKQLVAALIAAGCAAVGISGVDGALVNAQQLSEELKFTGKPLKTDGKLLDLLISGGFLPVVACIAGDAAGQIYNVNADQLAVSCAVGWRADKLFFLTDVPGVKDGSGQTLASLDAEKVRQLIDTGVAHGGMQAKLEASVWALESGLEEVVIAPGQADNICLDLLAGSRCGTSISLQMTGGVA